MTHQVREVAPAFGFSEPARNSPCLGRVLVLGFWVCEWMVDCAANVPALSTCCRTRHRRTWLIRSWRSWA